MIRRFSYLYIDFLSSIANGPSFFWLAGLARTSLAVGSLVTLVFSSPRILFDQQTYGSLTFGNDFDYLNLFTYFGFEHITAYYAVCILLLLIVISGYYPRLTAIPHWLVATSLFRSATILEGGDQLSAILTFLLIPIMLSDGRRNHWINSTLADRQGHFVANLSWWLIRIQMSILYLQSGVEKIYKLEEWKNGTALYYFFNDPIFGLPDSILSLTTGLLLNPYLISLLTWGVVAFELLLSGAIFMSGKGKSQLLFAGLLFHLGIGVLMGLVSFFFAMAGGLILYLASQRTQRRISTIIPGGAAVIY